MIRVTVFGVGQGLCSMVEILDDMTNTDVKFLAIMDLGWGIRNDILIQTITNKMKERSSYIYNNSSGDNIKLRNVINSNTPIGVSNEYYLDLLIYSHLDCDHINATESLFWGIENKCRIGKIFYGGSNALATQAATQVVNKLRTILPPMLIPDLLKNKELLYLDNSSNGEIEVNPVDWSVPMKLNILPRNISFYNVISGFKNKLAGFIGELQPCSDENKGSAIICIKYSIADVTLGRKDAHICFPGDPNVETLYQVNTTNLYPTLSTCEIMIAPHHGSGTTNKGYRINNYPQNTNPPQFDILDDFIDISKPEIVQISAGYDFLYNHPDANVVNIMKEYCTKSNDLHGVVCHSYDLNYKPIQYPNWVIYKWLYYADANDWGWHNIETDKSIWNTNSVEYPLSGGAETFNQGRIFICDNI